MKRIYVAGAYSGPDVITILDNMRKGMRLSTEVMIAGYAPFVPWFDFHFQLMIREGEIITLRQYYDYSIAWLSVSDAVIVVPNWENSTGTKKELEIARSMNIPIVYSLDELKETIHL